MVLESRTALMTTNLFYVISKGPYFFPFHQNFPFKTFSDSSSLFLMLYFQHLKVNGEKASFVKNVWNFFQ